MANNKQLAGRKNAAGTKIKAVAKPKQELGMDVNKNLETILVNGGLSSIVDISKLEGFLTTTQSREQVYRMIDTMSEDPILASYLKTISEDSVETNDSGQIVWCESDDDRCARYVTYLLDSMNVDKNAYMWMHSLAKYGDLYLRLYRESDYDHDDIFDNEKIREKERLDESAKGKELKESVNVVLHDADDHYVHYVEMVPNPGEMFELTKYGKTMGYVRAPINIQESSTTGKYSPSQLLYRMKRHDVDVYSATDYVHACLDDSSSRVPERVDIFTSDTDFDNNSTVDTHSYTVRRGQSELASVFKIWRELSLLENSALLNRITKSAVIRTVSVEVGDMPKEQVGAILASVKSLMEQKSAVNEGKSMSEYVNPGPIENNVYFPTRNGIGAVTANTIGGDFDPKQLTDISYFQDKLFGALGIPKAFFGVTDDGAGFNGGTSLAIQSSRYGKSVKRIQNTFCQMITDLINLMLLDKGLTTYINRFTIRMQAPVTQEELDRRENKKNRIAVVGDIMNQLSEIQNPVIKMKILKTLLADSVTDTEVIALLQDQIDELEAEGKDTDEAPGGPAGEPSMGGEPELPEPSYSEPSEPAPSRIDEPAEPEESGPEEAGAPETPVGGDKEQTLPSPNDIGQDFTDNSQF